MTRTSIVRSLDIYWQSEDMTAQYQAARANSQKQLTRIEEDPERVNEYKARVT